jgi:DNA-binding NarL/FixJ family response regulator
MMQTEVMTSPSLSSTTKKRILLVEDHPVVRHGLANLIDDEADLAVCGGAESCEQAISLVESSRPDVVLIDITLPDGSGLDLIKQLHETWPDLPLLALSMHDETLFAERVLRAGARGYVMKKEAMEKLLTAIRRVLAGEVHVSEKMASRMVQKLIDRSGAKTPAGLESLSDREFEVFNLIANGVGPSEIARRLGLSVRTIETHREHIKEKLGLKSGTELTRHALQWAMDQR